MFKWLLGRMMVRDFARDLRYARDEWGIEDARQACAFLYKRTRAVQLLDHDAQLAAALSEIANNVSVREAGWLHRLHPKSVASIILDDWLSAKHAVLLNCIHQSTFEKIDDELTSFVAGRLKPSEMRDICHEVSQTARNADQFINGLIDDYAAMAFKPTVAMRSNSIFMMVDVA